MVILSTGKALWIKKDSAFLWKISTSGENKVSDRYPGIYVGFCEIQIHKIMHREEEKSIGAVSPERHAD